MKTTQTIQFVTPDTLIGDAVMQYPVTAEIMMSYGLHCVGCHVSGIETIRQGAMGHGGMDEEDIQELVQEMNTAIAEREGAKADHGDSLFITKSAAKKIVEFSKVEEEQDGLFLRVAVVPGGCSGLRYSLDFDHEPREDDIVMDADTVSVRIDHDSHKHLRGAVLTYVDGLAGSGFKFDNPNAVHNCDCGDSFS